MHMNAYGRMLMHMDAYGSPDDDFIVGVVEDLCNKSNAAKANNTIDMNNNNRPQ